MTVLDVTAACLDIVKDAIIIFSLSFVVTGVLVGMLQTVFSVQDPGLPMASKTGGIHGVVDSDGRQHL